MAIKLRHLIRTIIICSFILFWSLPGYALDIEDIPNPRQTYGGWIADEAVILSDETKYQLNQKISQLKSSSGVELAIVTVPDLAPDTDSKTFATKLFNYWEIGDRQQNNGILFLVAVKEHRVEIETGSGITEISASQIGQIIDSVIRPQFRAGKFDLGTSEAAKQLITLLGDTASPPTNSNLRYLMAFLMLGACSLFGVINNLYEKFKDKKRPNIELDKSLIQQAARRKENSFSNDDNFCSSTGGNSGIGSFGDFGGGSSDGGGDGGDW